ncbi:hypothetical protein TNIN_334841 [Trichonephila inaurata madagascariensis]|uniref:Uncharacterized protein n=1 Tax=Trichonephila inaurata madagascariensis TaxID=2747483 RepID=A0A8X7BSA5_9ARAC|nr:hypothetical protein TNIN_334841 [Trichonephila inaurata madagascariensis]
MENWAGDKSSVSSPKRESRWKLLNQSMTAHDKAESKQISQGSRGEWIEFLSSKFLLLGRTGPVGAAEEVGWSHYHCGYLTLLPQRAADEVISLFSEVHTRGFRGS